MSNTKNIISGPLPVVAGVIRDPKNRILIAKRPASSRFGAGMWEFPGGKVDVTEAPEEALAREIKEETGIHIVVDDLMTLISHVYREQNSGLHILLMVYNGRWKQGEIQALEVADCKWIDIKDLGNYQFAVADQFIVNHLLAKKTA